MAQRSSRLALLSVTIVALIVNAPAGAAIPLQNKNPAEQASSYFGDSLKTPYPITRYDPAKACNGTTIFNDSINGKIVEIDMLGNVVWEYSTLPLIERKDRIGDILLLSNNNILFALGMSKGVFEIDRAGKVVWYWESNETGHVVDRLPNGNTVVSSMFGNWVKEVRPDGSVAWEWRAEGHFTQMYEQYREGVNKTDWVHINAVTRLPNGNTLISLRNLDLIIIVNLKGDIVWSFGAGILNHQHDPQVLAGNRLLVPDSENNRVIEVDMLTQEVLWEYREGLNWPRDADRLPNGNTLIVDSRNKRIIEVTKEKEIVWEFRMPESGKTGLASFLFKAERVCTLPPVLNLISPKNTTYNTNLIDIDIQSPSPDISTISYSIYDLSNKMWVSKNVTYLKNIWVNAITFNETILSDKKMHLGPGSYRVYIVANTTGWGDENLYEPKSVTTTVVGRDFTIVKPPDFPDGSLMATSVGVALASMLALFTYRSKKNQRR